MFRTEVTGGQIINALNADKTVFARIIDGEDGSVVMCPLTIYQYLSDDQPCMFQFSNLYAFNTIILVADDCNTPLEQSSDDPQPK